MSLECIALNNGCSIPPFGLGTYLGDGLDRVVKTAIDVGYRLIDCAFIYGNEVDIGKAFQAVLTEGKIKRDELFVVSKLWNTEHQPDRVLPAMKKSLQDLQLEYVDSYLMHWPIAQKPGKEEDLDVTIEDTWRAMEELVEKGYARSIGVSNFNSEQIKRVLKIATIKPVINQVECNPYISQEKLREFCKQQNIQVMAYRPFYAAGRSEKYGLNLFKEPIIEELGQKYGKSPAQIVLRYLVQCGVIPISKSDKVDRLKSNFDIQSFTISAEDFEKMRSLNKNKRHVTFPEGTSFKEYPFNIEF